MVEALGTACAVLAHDNRFNRWVAGTGAHYFRNQAQCVDQLDKLLDNEGELTRMRAASRKRHTDEFTWPRVLAAYEELLLRHALIAT